MKTFPFALPVACLLLSASTDAQSILYQTSFDDGAGWSGLTTMPNECGWQVDAIPLPTQGQGPAHSAPTSLNCNADLGGYSSCFDRSADSPPIDLSAAQGSTAELAFWCTYDLDEGDSCIHDARWVEVSNDGFQTTLLAQCYTSDDCPFGAWHPHRLELDPAWGTVQVRFFFDVHDGLFCNSCFEGWFVDDLLVTEGCTPVSYCTAGTTASGCTATLSSIGILSATASEGFSLLAEGVEGKKRGLFFFGVNGRQATPWGSSSSYQCVVPPVARGPLLDETGTQGLCDGEHTQDLNALWTQKPHLNPGPGALVQVQFWFRDPFATTNVKTSLSDALEVPVCP